jgi:prepilin-type N-terminal cleavage/methylation domain-containing protein
MKKIKAFSLVEMLITLGIMSIVLLIATETLNTIFRVSTISKFKTVTKNEIGFSIELVERLLSNSNVVDVYIYDSTPEEGDAIRLYNPETGMIEERILDNQAREIFYRDELSTGDIGTEVHIRPYGYSLWVCLGYFKGSEGYSDNGYLIKRTMTELSNGHESCFNTGGSSVETYPLLILNSEEVNVKDFRISYIKSSNINNVFYVDMEMEPTSWVPGDDSTISKSVIRQAIITTKGLTWY